MEALLREVRKKYMLRHFIPVIMLSERTIERLKKGGGVFNPKKPKNPKLVGNPILGFLGFLGFI